VPGRIDRNEAIEIIGLAKFGPAWVGPATDDEFTLAKKYRARFATGAAVPEHEREALYNAEEREARADRQHREVIHWLENHGFDCWRGLREGLDRDAFNKVFEAEFPHPRPTAPSIPKRVRYKTDDALVREGAAGIEQRKYPNALKAAEALASRAEGASFEARISRLRKKIRADIA